MANSSLQSIIKDSEQIFSGNSGRTYPDPSTLSDSALEAEFNRVKVERDSFTVQQKKAGATRFLKAAVAEATRRVEAQSSK